MHHEYERPWAPLFSIARENITEITVDGLIAVWAGPTHGPLLTLGDCIAPLWSRSLVKPLQLLTVVPTLKQAYPQLQSHHYAIMLSSHMGESAHQDTLKEIMAITGVSANQLQCPACQSTHIETALEAKASRTPPSPLLYPCSGKHLALLAALKASRYPLDSYLGTLHPYFDLYNALVEYLLDKPAHAFRHTTDGCGMPTLAIPPLDMAKIFFLLGHADPTPFLKKPPQHLAPLLAHWEELQHWMRAYPFMMGGTNRLDTRLNAGEILPSTIRSTLAKEGADGLLAVSLSPGTPYGEGLGILIKLACGYEPKHLEAVFTGLIRALGILPKDHPHASPPSFAANQPLETTFYFEAMGSPNLSLTEL